ncbi:hypothetical protein PMI08_03138, partial [Brevibacillus sp. CF112]
SLVLTIQMTLVVRKILASSSFAVSDTLLSLIKRLEKLIDDGFTEEDVTLDISGDVDEFDETVEEWEEDEGTDTDNDSDLIQGVNLQRLLQEKEELFSYYRLAQSITENEKGKALLIALSKGFEKLSELGANKKAVIFTESRRTQQYLKEMLEQNGYAGQIVMFNGTNNSPEVTEIYHNWLEKHKDDDQITGSKTADTRAGVCQDFCVNVKTMLHMSGLTWSHWRA